jgi:hypothetical protein
MIAYFGVAGAQRDCYFSHSLLSTPKTSISW